MESKKRKQCSLCSRNVLESNLWTINYLRDLMTNHTVVKTIAVGRVCVRCLDAARQNGMTPVLSTKGRVLEFKKAA